MGYNEINRRRVMFKFIRIVAETIVLSLAFIVIYVGNALIDIMTWPFRKVLGLRIKLYTSK